MSELIAMHETGEINVNDFMNVLNKNIDINKQDQSGETILNYLCIDQVYELIDLLMTHPKHSKKINVNLSNNRGETPLMRLCNVPTINLNAVSLLCKHGAQINQKDNDDNTSLLYALYQLYYYPQNEGVVKFLIEHGADVNVRNKKGNTPLSICRELLCKNHESLVKLLLESGANPYEAFHPPRDNGEMFHNIVGNFILEKFVNLTQQIKILNEKINNTDDTVN